MNDRRGEVVADAMDMLGDVLGRLMRSLALSSQQASWPKEDQTPTAYRDDKDLLADDAGQVFAFLGQRGIAGGNEGVAWRSFCPKGNLSRGRQLVVPTLSVEGHVNAQPSGAFSVSSPVKWTRRRSCDDGSREAAAFPLPPRRPSSPESSQQNQRAGMLDHDRLIQ